MSKHIEIIEIKVSATSDSSIGECMRESIEIAAKEWQNVRLIHNDKEYLIRPNDLVASIQDA